MNSSTQEAIKHLGRHRPYLVRYARAMGASPDDAQDCAQDALTKAWQHIDQFRGTNYDFELRGWLVVILRHRFWDRCKRSRTHAKYKQMLRTDLVTLCRGEDAYEVERVIRAVDKLSDAQRVVVTAYLLGSEYQEIAEQLSLPIGTVKSRLSRVREALSA